MRCLDHQPRQPFLPALRPSLQVTQQAQTGELGPQAVMEGGDTDSERRATFLELALALAGGLDAGALDTLYKAAKPGMQVGGLCCVGAALGGLRGAGGWAVLCWCSFGRVAWSWWGDSRPGPAGTPECSACCVSRRTTLTPACCTSPSPSLRNNRRRSRLCRRSVTRCWPTCASHDQTGLSRALQRWARVAAGWLHPPPLRCASSAAREGRAGVLGSGRRLGDAGHGMPATQPTLPSSTSPLAQVVETLTAASANSVSAAKRNRLRCLRTTVLAAARPGGPRLEGGEDDGGREEATKQVRGRRSVFSAGGVACWGSVAVLARRVPEAGCSPACWHPRRAAPSHCSHPNPALPLSWPRPPRPPPRPPPPACPKQMAASMVSEIILCVKERNKATRATAFELLVQIAHAMHDADPPPRGALNFDTQMGEEEAGPVCCRQSAVRNPAASDNSH